jgi:hypothetical protein
MSIVIAAAKRLAVRQEGGIGGMAEMIGVNPTTFAHKLTQQGSANLFVTEIERMTELTRDPEIAQALALLADCVLIPMAPSTADGALTEEIIAVGKEFGDVMRAAQEALKDGRVTARELANFDQQWMELNIAAAALRAELKRRVPAPPGDLKVAK